MRFKTRLSAAIGICIAIGPARSIVLPSASAQSTRPTTTQPIYGIAADEPAAKAPMRRWFDRLADSDPRVRDQAKVDLMGIHASDLPKLRQLVIDHQPILPSQAAALHDIVIQAFLADETYAAISGGDTTAGGDQSPFFLGILWTDQIEIDARFGVPVEERLPGFPSYRYLRTGDMILGIYIDPNNSLLQFPNTETHTIDQLKDAIKSRPDVQNVVLQVLRDGEQIRLAVKMAPRPTLSDPLNAGAIKTFTAGRADRSDAYWQDNFVPLLEARDAMVRVE